MPLVSDTQLDVLRAVGNNGLDSLATAIMRSVQVETDFGSEDAWATVALDQPCWIREMASTNVSPIVMALATVGTFRCHFVHGTDIQPGDRVVIGEDTYDVQGTNRENTIQIFATAIMRKVE